jgi:hypothetical protein
MSLTAPQRAKLSLLAEGAEVTVAARHWLLEAARGGGLTPADYASTSGLILELAGDVWVNVPISDNNPNFVGETPACQLDVEGDRLVVREGGEALPANFWPQPAYHGTTGPHGPLNHFAFTHGDRARLSPIRSCAMTCLFCNLPYDDPISTYELKPLEGIVNALGIALQDPIQPAHHVLVSGGTPKAKDAGFERDVYRTLLDAFPDIDIDVMMVPMAGMVDVEDLRAHGVHEVSLNIEIFSRERARALARQKYNQGLDLYLDAIERASEVLGPGRARSMLLVGLEPVEDTLAGVDAIARRGGTPVLSPFRPDPATPLRDWPPPSAAVLAEVYERGADIAASHGRDLGPGCPPCSHNTLAFPGPSYPYERPVMR